MQPTKLHIENFLSYGEVDLDLSQINIAALLGHNGAGKSSMLDSLTWSLYGEGRYKDIDRYIRQGQEQATVEHHFNLNGDTYRIIRGRSNKGKGKSTLEFARQNGAGWTPLSGDTIRETQAKIRETLRMDYDTFVSSCFILQGQSDKFCSAGATDRKRILGQILGLDTYEKLQESAKAKAKEHSNQVESIRLKIEGLDQELTEKPELSLRESLIRDKVRDIEQKKKALEVELQAKEEEKDKLQLQIAKLDSLREQKTALEKDIREIEVFLSSVREKEKDAGRLSDLEKQLTDISTEIKSQEVELEKAQKQLSKAEQDIERGDELRKQHTQLNSEIEKLEQQLKALEEKRNKYSQILERKEQILDKAEELGDVKKELQELDWKSSEFMKLSKDADRLEQLWAVWNKEQDGQRDSIEAELRSKRPLAETMKDVPCTGTAKDTCKLLASARDAVNDIAIIEERLKKLNEAINPHATLWLNATKARDELKYDPQRHQVLRAKVPELEKWTKYVPEITQAEEGLTGVQKQGTELQDTIYRKHGEKSDLESQLIKLDGTAAISYRRSLISDIKLKLSRNRTQEQMLRTDYGHAQAAEKQLEDMKAQAEQKKQEKEQNELQLLDILEHLSRETTMRAGMERLCAEIADNKEKLSQTRSEEQTFKIDLGKIQQKLEDLKAKEAEKKSLAVQVKEVGLEEHYYTQLVKAFGRNGIPALIVENAVPDIEDLSNDLLSRLSGGRMSVRLDTQKESKSTGNISESLDIIISDELGDRPYEGWSGAEKFDTDIALRLAISKFLARRAGTKIETLVIDEGASCLDAEGRQRFVEAIHIIAEDFAKIICITHIDELKECFPQQLIVQKTPEGSRVEVVA